MNHQLEIEKIMPPIILMWRNNKRYMVTFHKRKVASIEVSCTDKAGFQFWREIYCSFGKQASKASQEIINFAESNLPATVL